MVPMSLLLMRGALAGSRFASSAETTTPAPRHLRAPQGLDWKGWGVLEDASLLHLICTALLSQLHEQRVAAVAHRGSDSGIAWTLRTRRCYK